jgi:hypothetical protein
MNAFFECSRARIIILLPTISIRLLNLHVVNLVQTRTSAESMSANKFAARLQHVNDVGAADEDMKPILPDMSNMEGEVT